MISNMISYHVEDLTVLSPEAVPFHIEGIAACLRPSTIELTLPLNGSQRIIGWDLRYEYSSHAVPTG